MKSSSMPSDDRATLSTDFGLWYHPLYTDGIHPEARFPRDRYQLLLSRLQASDAHLAID